MKIDSPVILQNLTPLASGTIEIGTQALAVASGNFGIIRGDTAYITNIYGNGSNITGLTSTGANVSLSNLSSVAINTALVSDSNDTDDLGTDAIIWRDMYLGGLRHGLGAGVSCGLDLLMSGSGFTSQINFTGTDYTNVFFQAGKGVSSSRTGRNITLKGGNPNTDGGTSATGGSVYLTGANGNGTSGVGGSIIMTPGTGTAASGVAEVVGKFGIRDVGSSYYTFFTSPIIGGNQDYLMPTAVPTATSLLQSASNGVLSWVSPTESMTDETRITYVPAGANLSDYITAATAGDTLQLGSYTLTPTEVFDINKKLTIKGCGKSATLIACSADSLGGLFNITAADVTISDLEIAVIAGGTHCFTIGASGSDYLANTLLDNISIIEVNSDDALAIEVFNADLTMNHVTGYATNSVGSKKATFLKQSINANCLSAECSTTIKDCSVTAIAESDAKAYEFYDGGSAEMVLTASLVNSVGFAISVVDGVGWGAAAYGGTKAEITLAQSYFYCSSAELYQADGALVSAIDTSLVNGLATGTIDKIGATLGDRFVGTYLQSTVSTGSTPIIVASTDLCGNLNADMLDGYHATSFLSATASGSILGTSFNELNTMLTTSSVIPQDNSVPQSNEGLEVLRASITPKSATSKLRIEVCLQANVEGVNERGLMALFRDSTAGAIAAGFIGGGSTGGNLSGIYSPKLIHYVTSGSTDYTTFKVHVGTSGGNSVTVNGAAGSQLFSGTSASTITITEIAT